MLMYICVCLDIYIFIYTYICRRFVLKDDLLDISINM